MYLRLTFLISGGIVALNNQVLSFLGVFCRMNSISSWKPILSISSASSSTTYLISPRLIALRSIKSIKRPGVATTICTPLLMSRICIPMEAPPYTATTLIPFMCVLKISISFTICKQSSRVGHTINACGCFLLSSSRCSKGNPNAAVLPVPVCARPIKSVVPLNKTGIAFS